MSDDRISNIAGVYVDSIKVQRPPYDQPGVIQEFVGEGWTKDFMLEPASAVTGNRIQEFVDNSVSELGSTVDRVKLEYNLLIRARAERGARAKTRGYIRGVNPFAPRVIHIESLEETSEFDDMISNIDPTGKFYKVRVFVAK